MITDAIEQNTLRGPARLLSLARLYAAPLLLLGIAIPLVGYSIYRSTFWLDRPFPGFIIMDDRVIPTVGTYDWPIDRESLFHAEVTAIDGHPVQSGAEVYRLVSDHPLGTRFEYAFRAPGGRRFSKVLASVRWSIQDYAQVSGVFLGFGMLSLLGGAAVGFLQPATTQARVFVLQAFVAGTYAVSSTFLHQAEFPFLGRVCVFGENLFPATFIHLALVFPVERDLSGRRRLCVALPYIASVMLYAFVQIGLDRDPPSVALLPVTYLYIAGSIVFFVGSMVQSYIASRDPLVRSRVKAVLPGLVLGTAVMCFAFVHNALMRPAVSIQMGLLATLVFYVSVAYAIAKHDLFDVDRVVRQSFVYAVLSLVVLGVYALGLIIPSRLLPWMAGRESILGAVLVLALALLFDPLQRRVQALVDRAFYRSRLDYRATIAGLSETMTSLLRLDDVVAQVTRVVSGSMHLECIAVALRQSDQGAGGLWVRRANEEARYLPIDLTLEQIIAQLERMPNEFDASRLVRRLDDDLREPARECLAALEAEVVMPLVVRGSAMGALTLGRKLSGRNFDTEDIELLRTLSNQTAIAIQNARSYDALETLNRELDEKVRQRTAELRESHSELSRAYDDLKNAQSQLVQSEKMASLGQLVAGVAHELNNPASFVHGAIQNLTEYLSRIIEIVEVYESAAAPGQVQSARERLRIDYVLRETPKLIRICEEGSQRIKEIVDDLRLFARADGGERVPTRIPEALDTTLSLLRDRLSRTGVEIERVYEDVPHIEASPAQLNRVWMNLLTNAIDAAQGRPDAKVRLSVRRTDDERIEVRVCDNGVGIAAQDLPKVFEPFFTTKPVGQGTGLGLSIAYSAINAHGGTIEAESSRGDGTTVTVRLPIRDARQRPQAGAS